MYMLDMTFLLLTLHVQQDEIPRQTAGRSGAMYCTISDSALQQMIHRYHLVG